MATKEEIDIADLVQNGLHALVLGFGYKVGIVDVICQLEVPCSAEDISKKGNFRLRYVQEWLRCMVAGGILKVGDDDKYWYPMEKQVFHLQALVASSIHLLSNCVNDLEKVFKQTDDGPAGYAYPSALLDFVDKLKSASFKTDWMETDIKPVMDLFKSFDIPVQVLDLGCGDGRVTVEMAKRFPKCNIIGIDNAERSINAAKNNLQQYDVKNLNFMIEDGENMPLEWNDKFDCILLVDSLHEMVNVDRVLLEIKRVLKPDGYVATFDPHVQSKHMDSAGDPQARFFMPYNVFMSLPNSMSRDPAIGFGHESGYENQKKRIEDMGFRVIKEEELNKDCSQERIVFQKVH